MTRIVFIALMLLASSLHSTTIYSSTPPQKANYIYPLDIPATLSSNFGELRANHFHSGIDLKTQGVINKLVRSVEDGYVSRIAVSAYGYGLALYIDHPKTGHTSVYAHLHKYSPQIAEYIKKLQYERESYVVDISLNRNEIPVKKGEIVAYSGNSGSSGGPHVHFELRTTIDQAPIDPLPYYKYKITDNRKPQVRGIAIYPQAGEGVVNGSASPDRHVIKQLKNGSHSAISRTIRAWGTIGLGVNAIDRMNNANNIYGVKKVRIYCDGIEFSNIDIETFRFDESKMINSFTDFDYWKHQRSFFMKSFVMDGNKLRIYKKSVNKGLLNINEEREYKIKYELEDAYGNQTNYSFSIFGKKQDIPSLPLCSLVMLRDENNYFVTDDFSLNIAKHALYSDICFNLGSELDESYYSRIFHTNYNYVPLDSYADISLKLSTDTLVHKNQYGILQLENGKEAWLGGNYIDGHLNTRIRELGNSYTVGMDDEAPSITAINPSSWVQKKQITIQLTDNLSGIKSFKATIDSKFVLFEYDSKSNKYNYYFDDQRLTKGGNHELLFVARDAAGNKSSYSYSFNY